MKFTNFIAAVALPVLALFVSCEQKSDVVAQISTDKGTYECAAEGGDVTVKLLATQDWTAVVSPASSLDVTDGITVKPASGKASEAPVEVTINLAANKDYDREALITFNGVTISAAVTLAQKGAQGERLLECTIAEFLAKPVDASVYYVLTGEAANIASPDTYSNFDLVDPKTGDKVYIYGCARKEDPSNQKIGLFNELGIQDGDIVTIASTRGAYNGTPQGAKSYYISHKKSEKPVIKLDKDAVTAAVDTEFELAVTANKASWTLSSDVSWLSFTPASGSESATVKVAVSAEGEGDTGVITLKADGLESVSCTVTRTNIQDISVADFLAAEVNSKMYRLTGKIESIVNDTYGNLYLQDASGKTYVYGVTSAPQAKNDKSFGSLGLRQGDVVTLIGTRSYSDKAKQDDQKDQLGGAYLESSVKSEDVSVSDFLKKEVANKFLEDPYYRLTGVVKEIVNDSYGNFYLKEKDSDTYVYVYGLTVAPVQKNDKSFGSLGIKVGDEVTLVGQRGSYASSKVEDQKQQVSNAYFISVKPAE